MNFLFLYWQEQTNDEQNKYKVLIKKKVHELRGGRIEIVEILWIPSQQLEEEKNGEKSFPYVKKTWSGVDEHLGNVSRQLASESSSVMQ